MPLFNFQCDVCKRGVRRIFSVADSQAYEGSICFDEGKCQGRWQRLPTGPTSQVVERLDNNAMPRAVERLSDAERLNKERSRTEPKE